jgi:hypothetical protein
LFWLLIIRFDPREQLKQGLSMAGFRVSQLDLKQSGTLSY